MKLSNYLSGLLDNFKDSRIVRNVTDLVQDIIANQTIRLWTLSRDKAEFAKYKRLVDGSLKSEVDAASSATALRERSVAALESASRVILLHDPCDIRKPHAQEMENLGKVRDLEGNIINGYQAFATNAVNEKGSQMAPADVTIYSNGDPQYVTVAELEEFHAGKLADAEDPETQARAAEIAELVETETYINLPQLTRAHLTRVSAAFKAAQPERPLCHVLDRQFDGLPYFQLIDQELEDEFVIRVKVSRNSNEQVPDPKTGKLRAVKLVEVALPGQATFVVPKLTVRHRLYQDVQGQLEWGTLKLENKTYSVVRVTLRDRHGRPIHKNPMLLLTNMHVETAEQARDVYHLYLMRAKIEAVFKFLKTVLGWEEFQVQDYVSIQNLLALAYFISGYFYEMGSSLTENPTLRIIAELGGGKGKVTRYYVLRGLRKLLVYEQVELFVKEQDIGSILLGEMFAWVT